MISRYIRSNVLGFVAIFIALGGVGVAAGLGKNSVKSKHIKNNQVKAVDVKSAQVQLRVGSSCPAGEAIRVVNVDGTVACEADDVGAGGGAPTGAAGGDLSGTYPNPLIADGAITIPKLAFDPATQAELDAQAGGGAPSGPAGGALAGTYPDPQLADDAVTSAKVAANDLTAADIGDGLGLSEIDETAFQRRISGGCASGSSIRTVAQDGTATCEADDDTINPGGNAGGDLAGSTYPNPSLAAGAVEPDEIGALPAARVRSSGDPTLTNNSVLVMPLVTEEFDIGGIHDPATNTKLTAPIDGIYSITGAVAFAPNGAGDRSVQIRRNNISSALAASQVAPASAAIGTDVPVTTIAELNAGDFVELLAFQNSGGDLGTFSSRTVLSMVWLGPDP